MPRTLRRANRANYNHVILRGITEVPVFVDDEDREKFLELLSESINEYDIELHAYCLMDNHIHLLVFVQGDCLSAFIQKLASRYVSYYNYRHLRSGSLFQGRFRHEPIRNRDYYLSVLRYIHKDPENSGIGAFDSFKWSSFLAFKSASEGINGTSEGEPGVSEEDTYVPVTTTPALDMLRGFEGFYEFVSRSDDIIGMDIDNNSVESDERVSIFLSRRLNIKTPRAINKMSIKSRNMLIREMRALGITASQISRLTGVSRTIIYKLEY